MQKRLVLTLDVLLLALCGWLSFQVYQAWHVRPGTGAPAGAPAQAESPEAAGPAPAGPAGGALAAYAVVAERNLFSPNRQETPPAPAQPARSATPATPPGPKPRLYGVTISADGKARAYLEDVQKKKVFGYAIGDTVGDSRLEQIKDDRVVLRRDAEVYEVMLRDPSKPKPPPTAAVANPFAAAAAAVQGRVAPAAPTPATPLLPGGQRPPLRSGRPTPAPAVTPPAEVTNPFAATPAPAVGPRRRAPLPAAPPPAIVRPEAGGTAEADDEE